MENFLTPKVVDERLNIIWKLRKDNELIATYLEKKAKNGNLGLDKRRRILKQIERCRINTKKLRSLHGDYLELRGIVKR